MRTIRQRKFRQQGDAVIFSDGAFRDAKSLILVPVVRAITASDGLTIMNYGWE